MYVDTDGVVIRQVKTTDGRRMLLLFTRQYGKISAGTSINERGKSKSALAIRPFTYGHYDIFKGRNYYSLNGAEVKNSFYKIGEDVDKFMLASQMLEFTDKLLPENKPNERIFDTLVDFFRLLAERKSKHETLSAAYQFRALKFAGLEPQLNSCTSCGKKPESTEKATFAYFSVEDGGLLCEDCAAAAKKAAGGGKNLIYKVHFDIINILRYFMNNPLEKLKSVGLADDKMQEVSKILSAYIEYHLGIEDIMSKDIYNLLKKDN